MILLELINYVAPHRLSFLPCSRRTNCQIIIATQRHRGPHPTLSSPRVRLGVVEIVFLEAISSSLYNGVPCTWKISFPFIIQFIMVYYQFIMCYRQSHFTIHNYYTIQHVVGVSDMRDLIFFKCLLRFIFSHFFSFLCSQV